MKWSIIYCYTHLDRGLAIKAASLRWKALRISGVCTRALIKEEGADINLLHESDPSPAKMVASGVVHRQNFQIKNDSTRVLEIRLEPHKCKPNMLPHWKWHSEHKRIDKVPNVDHFDEMWSTCPFFLFNYFQPI